MRAPFRDRLGRSSDDLNYPLSFLEVTETRLATPGEILSAFTAGTPVLVRNPETGEDILARLCVMDDIPFVGDHPVIADWIGVSKQGRPMLRDLRLSL